MTVFGLLRINILPCQTHAQHNYVFLGGVLPHGVFFSITACLCFCQSAPEYERIPQLILHHQHIWLCDDDAPQFSPSMHANWLCEYLQCRYEFRWSRVTVLDSEIEIFQEWIVGLFWWDFKLCCDGGTRFYAEFLLANSNNKRKFVRPNIIWFLTDFKDYD